MKYRLLVGVLGVIFVACPKPKSDPKNPKPTPGTQPTSTSATKPQETQPATKATEKPSVKRGDVFFVATGKDNLAPLVCFDAGSKSFLEGDDCLPWLTPEKKVRDESGATAALSPVAQPCASGKAFAGVAGAFAFWPTDAASTLIALEPIDVKKLSDAEKKAIAKEVKLKTKEKHEITFVSSLDANGDGKKDRFYGAVAKKPAADDSGASFSFSGLFFADGTKPNVLSLISSSASEKLFLRGALDLDQDKSSELWLERILVEENIEVSRQYTFERLSEGALEELASREACLQ